MKEKGAETLSVFQQRLKANFRPLIVEQIRVVFVGMMGCYDDIQHRSGRYLKEYPLLI